MAKTNWQDPKTSEMRSTHISGLMEAVGKVEDSIGMATVTETNIPLTEVFISSDDRYRIFQAPEGKRNWTAEQAPVIKKNGAVISSGFEIDYGGGAIILNVNDTVANTYTADVTYIKIGKIPKSARFVIGTSTAGWTESDCDYLCDGTDDQVEINNAITALPATGGEIVILDGTYNITAKIDVNKSNVSIRGNGNATILKRMYHSSVVEGVITLLNVTGCKVADLQVDGNKTTYTAIYNHGIYLTSSSSNTITGNTCNNNSYGIYLTSSSNNTITGNTCNNDYRGIYLYSSSNENTIAGNTCYNNNYHGIYLDSSSNNTITGNTCNSNNYGIQLSSSSNNTIIGNTCIRGTGQTSDYTSSQYTINLLGSSNNYNLISSNNCMGKAVVVEGGTGNTVINNKWNDTSDFEDLRTDVGDKSSLTTDNKTNLVSAINEHETQINDLDAEVVAHKAENVHYHVRTATVVVAAYDSKYKQFADFVSSGGDDRLLIAGAINALPENGGKIVLLDGTYNISTMLQILGRNIWLAGCGVNTILKVSSDFRPEGLHMMVSDMVIDFDGDNSKLYIYYGNSQILTRLTIKNSTAVNTLSVDNITVDNCKFENNVTHLRINGSNTLITNCRFSGYKGTDKGLFIYTSATDTMITNCYIDALKDIGINTVVTGNIIREA